MAAWRSTCAFPPTALVHKIPDGISIEDAAIIEPLACAIHAVNRGDIQLDDVVVIAGAGPLGLMMVQVAQLKTPRKLVVIDLVDERLELARRYGADVTINPKRGRRARRSSRAHRRLRLRRVYRGHRLAERRVQGLDLIRKLGRFVEFSVFGAMRPSTGRSSATARSSTCAARISGPIAIRSRSTCWNAGSSRRKAS